MKVSYPPCVKCNHVRTIHGYSLQKIARCRQCSCAQYVKPESYSYVNTYNPARYAVDTLNKVAKRAP